MILYHGSNQRIADINLDICRPNKDFGRGFYLTNSYSRAVEMATRRTMLENTGDPDVTRYIFNRNQAGQSLEIRQFKTRSAEWAKFILQNRIISGFTHGYDIVIGPVADSRVDNLLRAHLDRYGGQWDDPQHLEILAKSLRYPGEEYIQYCFCTQNAIDNLTPDI